MAIRNQLMAGVLTDLYSSPITDQQTIVLWGQTTLGDVPVRYYLYDASSTATDDGGVTVVQPSAVTGSGRYLIQTNGQTLSDWNSNSGYSKINNKPSLAAVATTGDYANLSNKPTIPGLPTITSNVSRPINSTTFTISTTKQANVSYSVKISCTASIGSSSAGTVSLQYSTDSGSTWIEVSQVSNSNTVTLALTLNAVTVQTAVLSGNIPANALVKMVQTTSGTTTITYINGQEMY